MATTRAAKPARKPVGATRAPTKTSTVKKSAAKKATKPKSAKTSKQEFAATQHAAGACERDADLPPATCIALVERITRAVERELSQIEAIVGGHYVEPALRAEAERRARTLASLAHTLTEVRKLRADEEKSKAGDDDPGPEDINTFRLELAQKLDRLAAEAQKLFPVESDAAGER
jgi:hypothetical protein